MEQKQEKTTQQQQTIKYKLLPLFKTNVTISIIPLHLIEVVFQIIPYLQMLKFSIDYFSLYWLGSIQPIFLYLDLRYYLNLTSSKFSILLAIAIAYMNLYWIIQLSLFITNVKMTNMANNIKKIFFIISRNILFLPFLNIVLDLYSCNSKLPFRTCYSNYNSQIQIGALLSFFFFALLILFQTFFNFQFLKHKKEFRVIKRSSFSQATLLAMLITFEIVSFLSNSLTQLIILALGNLLMLIVFLLKDEHLSDRIKLLELSLIAVNHLALIMVAIIYFTNQQLTLLLFFMLAVFLTAGIMRLKTYSLKFELQNINKWPTADIMIRYTQTLRYYLSRRSQYLFKVYIHGYMEIHRQKCDSLTCPSRSELSEAEKKIFESGQLKKEDEQLLRAENIIKKIYGDGYKLTPVNAQLQLQNSIFLYEKCEKQLALKTLLLVKYQQLPFDKYYKYNLLKERIHLQMCEQPNKMFLDLVSELYVKREEDLILEKFEKAALINLQFWSVLNEDHPDFQKLNEISSTRIRIKQEVKQSYNKICDVAHSEKVTSLYVHYLEAIQNDEEMYNEIYDGVKGQFDLENKIVLQDWANTSSSILLVSIEETNYGNIIGINSSCSSMFGYERYQILNRPLKLLFAEELRFGIKEFLDPFNSQETYYMSHKSGYLLKIKRKSRNFNSMETGMAAIITINIEVTSNNCFFVLGNDGKLLGVSASIIPLIGVQIKMFEGELYAESLFNFAMQSLTTLPDQNTYTVYDLIKDYQNQSKLKDKTFSRVYKQFKQFKVIQFIEVKDSQSAKRSSQSLVIIPINFQFQVQATLTSFKFYGNFDNHETYLSQFSQLQYAQSLKQSHPTKKYSEGIITLRLKQNIIQVIQQGQQQQVNGLKKRGGEQLIIQNIPRKDEEVIFYNKSNFQEFIENYKYAKSMNCILFVSMVGLLALYITFFVIFTRHNNAILGMTEEIAYQNLIIGSITKEVSLINTLNQMAAGSSPDTVTRFQKIYLDNINYMEQIQLFGSDSITLNISLSGSQLSFLSDQFIISFLNYAQELYGNMSSAVTQQDLVTIYKATSPSIIAFLQKNCQSVKEQLMAHAIVRGNQIAATIKNYIQVQILMIIGGLLFTLVFAFVLIMAVHKINKERINIFQIFLHITQIQIAQFSSKTQKFLLSLHVEDTNGQVDVDQQVENTKKINNSTFAKKKRFKLINFNKWIYLKLLIIPIFSTTFFIQSFVQSYTNLSFQQRSYNYFFLTSLGDYNFYSGLNQIQTALLNNQAIPKKLSENYIYYYKDYYDLHFQTFGYVADFHTAFTDIFMTDICNGVTQVYGSTQIVQSCDLPMLNSNGSQLIFTDITMKTQFFANASSFTYEYIVGYEVLSKTHRLLTNFLIMAQSGLINSTLNDLLTCLLIWTIVMVIVVLIYGIPIMKRFIDETNQIKNIISILPISVVKNLPLASRYLNKIIRSQKDCWA